MREAIDKLDYVGFTYNNIHSSQLGLKSVSSGNRYQKDLLPVAQDYTTDVLGGDGTYFFGTKFKNNETANIARIIIKPLPKTSNPKIFIITSFKQYLINKHFQLVQN